jgi:hypothetical protein
VSSRDGIGELGEVFKWFLRACCCLSVMSKRVLTVAVLNDLQQKRMRLRHCFAYFSIVAYVVTLNARRRNLSTSVLSVEFVTRTALINLPAGYLL